MVSDEVSCFERYAMYNAVRLFGWIIWNKHNKEEVNAYRKYVTCVPLV